MEIRPILDALFGSAERHAEGRQRLREAYLAARAEGQKADFERTKPSPEGSNWVVINNQLAIDRTEAPEDTAQSALPLSGQMQKACVRRAAELVESCASLRNTAFGGELYEVAKRFHDLIDCPPSSIPERLFEIYDTYVGLAGMVERNAAIPSDRLSADDPLDAKVAQQLAGAVTISATWLMEYPSIERWIDGARTLLVSMKLTVPASEFVELAHQSGLIGEREAQELRGLARAAKSNLLQGQNAAKRLNGTVKNLLRTTAAIAASFMLGAISSQYAVKSVLANVAANTLLAGESQIVALASLMPAYFRHALVSLLRDWQAPTLDALAPPPVSEEPSVPEDVEAKAVELILAGKAPPEAWVPYIRRLQFQGTTLSNLAPIAGLTGLQSLDLDGTQVTDFAPIAGLTGLQSLSLVNTQVTDLAPIASLNRLDVLAIMGTAVTDISPLDHLDHLNIIGAPPPFPSRPRRAPRRAPRRV